MAAGQLEQLSHALVEAFPNARELATFLEYKLSERLNVHVNVNAGLASQVDDLIDWAAREKRLNELVFAAAQERPRSAALQALAADLAPDGIPLGAGAEQRAEPLVIPGQDGVAQYCNRREQWKQVKGAEFASCSELVFVPGAVDRGHDYFIKRIKRQLKIDPKTVIEVGSPAAYLRPQTPRELLDGLGMALGLAPAASEQEQSKRIASHLARRMSQSNVVLAHATLSMRFQKGIVDYYTQSLPAILRDARMLGGSLKCLKCYQAIEWNELPWTGRMRLMILRGLGSHDGDRGTGELSALNLMSSIEANAPADVLRVRRVPELLDITEDDLVEFCGLAGLSEDDQRQLLEECSGSPTTNRKLKIVDALVPTFIPIRKQRFDDDQNLD
jgi:Effector-associated domain 1/inactive STAND